MAEKKLTVAQEIAELLKQNANETPEGYKGTEWVEAVELLPSDLILKIPFCVYDMIRDEHGVIKLESKYGRGGLRLDERADGTIDPDWEASPERRLRLDVLAVLAWIPLRRETPDMTLEAVLDLINDENVRDLMNLTYKFWGIDVDKVEKQIEEAEAELEARQESQDAGTDAADIREAEEQSKATDAGNFPD